MRGLTLIRSFVAFGAVSCVYHVYDIRFRALDVNDSCLENALSAATCIASNTDFVRSAVEGKRGRILRREARSPEGVEESHFPAPQSEI